MKTESDSSIDSPRSTKSTRGSTYTRSHDSPISSIFFRDKKSNGSPVGLEMTEYPRQTTIKFAKLKKASSGEEANLFETFKGKKYSSTTVFPKTDFLKEVSPWPIRQ